MEEENEEKGFKVKDRRRFDESGEVRDGADGDPEQVEESAAEDSAPPAEGAEEGQRDELQEPAAPGQEQPGKGELTFSSFVVGLATQAFMFLGAVANPESGLVAKDLGQAAALIDVISMLGEKTAGNLSEDEQNLVEELLYELRMRYVSETRTDAEKGKPQ